jgi:hypothetical protein
MARFILTVEGVLAIDPGSEAMLTAVHKTARHAAVRSEIAASNEPASVLPSTLRSPSGRPKSGRNAISSQTARTRPIACRRCSRLLLPLYDRWRSRASQ